MSTHVRFSRVIFCGKNSKANQSTIFLFRDKEILASYIKDVESALGKVGSGLNG